MESLLQHGQFAFSTTFSPTVTSWCELRVPCADIGLHTGVTWCSDFKLCVLPTGHTQCRQSTGSDGPHPHCHNLPSVSHACHGALHLCECFPPPPLPIPTPPLYAATQTTPRTAVSQDVSTQLSFEEFSLRFVHPYNPSGALAPLSTHDVLCPTCSRPVPSLLLDAAVQTPLYSVTSHDGSTQLPLTEFFTGCIFSNDHLDRQASPSAHCNAGSASPPQPADIASLCSPSSASHASDATAPRVLPQPPLGLEKYARQYASHGIPDKAALERPRLCTSISVTPPQPQVSTTQVGTHPVRSATTYKRSASTALAGTHNPVGADPRAGTGPFPKPRALILPMVKFG